MGSYGCSVGRVPSEAYRTSPIRLNAPFACISNWASLLWQAQARAAAAAEAERALTFRPRTRSRPGVEARVDMCHPEAYRARLQERSAAHSAQLAQRQVCSLFVKVLGSREQGSMPTQNCQCTHGVHAATLCIPCVLNAVITCCVPWTPVEVPAQGLLQTETALAYIICRLAACSSSRTGASCGQ